MEDLLASWFAEAHWSILAATIAFTLFTIGRGADWLVDQAVSLSSRSGLPKTVIGATVVSLGTTTPEAAVSVLAAVGGDPDLALGNAVGSIICDTGLILGLACLITPLPLDRRVLNRQGWIQVAAAVALVLACIPWASPLAAATTGGVMPQWMGFIFLGCLALYMWKSIQWAGRMDRQKTEQHEEHAEAGSPLAVVFLKLAGALALVILSAQILIPAVEEAARRASIPESVIAATIVAFGTSLPELVTSVTAALRRHGELAIGNVVGADILNVLFVSGAAAAATPGGLAAEPYFFRALFPAMLGVLAVFRIGVASSQSGTLGRPFGVVLIVVYIAVTLAGYISP